MPVSPTCDRARPSQLARGKLFGTAFFKTVSDDALQHKTIPFSGSPLIACYAAHSRRIGHDGWTRTSDLPARAMVLAICASSTGRSIH